MCMDIFFLVGEPHLLWESFSISMIFYHFLNIFVVICHTFANLVLGKYNGTPFGPSENQPGPLLLITMKVRTSEILIQFWLSLFSIIKSSAWLRLAQRSSVPNLTQIFFAQKSLSVWIGSEKLSFWNQPLLRLVLLRKYLIQILALYLDFEGTKSIHVL